MLRIAIEALGIGRYGGGRTATLNLLHPLLAADEANEYIIYVDSPEPSLDGLNGRACQHVIPVHNRFLARLVLQAWLPVEFRRQHVDLVHFMKNQVVSFTGARTIATVYDLTTLRHPEAYPRSDVWYWQHILQQQFKRVDSVVAISQATADDLLGFCGVSPKRVHVIYPGYDPARQPATLAQIQEARSHYGLGDAEYFIHVGNLSIKKNLAMLLDAFAQFRRKTGFAGRLVLVGAHYHKGHDARFFEKLSQPDMRDAILLTGAVPDHHLNGLYSGAVALLFPSLHEGFGLVPLEAMACGTPVIAHAAGAVREVVGDAGLIIQSAVDVSAWCQVIEKVMADSALRQHLRRAGLARARLFTAEISARQTLQMYQQVSSER